MKFAPDGTRAQITAACGIGIIAQPDIESAVLLDARQFAVVNTFDQHNGRNDKQKSCQKYQCFPAGFAEKTVKYDGTRKG